MSHQIFIITPYATLQLSSYIVFQSGEIFKIHIIFVCQYDKFVSIKFSITNTLAQSLHITEKSFSGSSEANQDSSSKNTTTVSTLGLNV